jgi:hypothetical protein
MMGWFPPWGSGESAGLYDLIEEAGTGDSPSATAKTTCVAGEMLADADSMDDLETRVEVNPGGFSTPCPTRSCEEVPRQRRQVRPGGARSRDRRPNARPS